MSVQSSNTERRSTLQAQEHAQFPFSRSHFSGPCNDRDFVILNSNNTKVKHSSYEEQHRPPHSAPSRRSLLTWPLKELSFWLEISAPKLKSHQSSSHGQSHQRKLGEWKNTLKMKLHYHKRVKKTIIFFSSSSGNEWKLRSMRYIN